MLEKQNLNIGISMDKKMRNKKILACMILGITVVISACSKENNALESDNKTQVEADVTTENNDDIENGSNTDDLAAAEENNTNVEGEMDNKTEVGLRVVEFNYNTNQLELKDLLKGEVTTAVDFEKTSFIQEQDVFEVKDGYAAIVSVADEPVTIQEVSGISMINIPTEIKERNFQFYDRELNLQKVVPLDGIVSKDFMDFMPAISVAWDGSKVVFASLNEVYLYDMATQTTNQIFNEENNEVFFEKVSFTQGNKFAFFGSRVTDNEGDTCYGTYDLDTEIMLIHTEKQYRADNISTTANYVCITDIVEPYKNHKASGRVLLLDLRTDAVQVVEVGSLESSMARLTQDEKSLLTVSEEGERSFLMRQYDIETGKVKSEQKLNQESETKVIDIKPTGEIGNYAAIFNAGNGTHVISTFKCEE